MSRPGIQQLKERACLPSVCNQLTLANMEEERKGIQDILSTSHLPELSSVLPTVNGTCVVFRFGLTEIPVNTVL